MWYDALLHIQGEVEFLVIYPPQVAPRHFADRRVRVLTGGRRGEVSQRLLGLQQARGSYVLALDDDDYAHPEIAALTENYFARFPESWVLRPLIQDIAFDNADALRQPWMPLPDILTLPVIMPQAVPHSQEYCIPLPIAPLETRFRWRHLFVPWSARRDMSGVHFENFNNRVWKNARVQPALAALATSLERRPPRFTLDRLLGLYVQAYYFQRGSYIGHWLRGSYQIRRTYRPTALKERRNYFWADSLLARHFPQYGYLWNLFFWSFYRSIGF